MRSLARWGALPLIGMPLGSWALTLGELEVISDLNQPLNAEIAFSATADELATLSVELAPARRFLDAGLDYPAFLNSLDFRLTSNLAGERIIRVTSTQAVSEPFVSIILTASHARGTIFKEYTLLLDPPLFLPAETALEPIAAPVTRPESTVAGGPIEREAPAPAPAPRPGLPAEAIAEPDTSPIREAESVAEPLALPEPEVASEPLSEPEPAFESAPVPEPESGPGFASLGENYTVQGGDTLWGITTRIRPDGVSVNQAMLAIFEANPAAFDGNINRLRRGAILRIPPAAGLSTMGATAATAEVQRQIDIWRGEIESTPQLVLLPPVDEPADFRLGSDESASSASNIGETSADVETAPVSAEAESEASGRLLEITSNALADLQQQLEDGLQSQGAADTEIAEEPEAIFVDETLSDAAADTEISTETEVTPEAAVAPEAEVAADEVETERESSVRASSAPVVSQAPSSPSLVDQILDWVTRPIFAISAGVIVVLLAGLAFLRRRRDASDEVTGQWEALEAEIDEEADRVATARLRGEAEASDMVVVEGHSPAAEPEEQSFGVTGSFDEPADEPVELPSFDSGRMEDESLGGIDTLTGIDPLDDLDSLGDIDPLGDLGLGDDGTDDSGLRSAAVDTPMEPDFPLADQTLSSQTVINLDQADPIAEADFHMAYGLYDQAADLISKALETDPNDRELKLKLLEVYFVWGNKEQFLENATSLKNEIGGAADADWDKVVIMGKQICPDEVLFASATAAASEVDLDLESGGTAIGLDFAFDDDNDSSSLDLDIIEDSAPSLEASGFEAVGAPVDDDLLDIGAATQAGLEAALLDDTDDAGGQTMPSNDFEDFAATMEAPTLESPTLEPDFGIDDTVEQEQAAAVGSDMTAELDIDDLGLDLGDLDDLPGDIADMPDATETLSLGEDVGDDLLSATGVTQVLDPGQIGGHLADDLTGGDQTGLILEDDFDSDTGGITTEVLEQPVAGLDPEPLQTESDLDLNLDDFSSALEGGDTAEHLIGSAFDDLDLDVGIDVPTDDEPTGTEAANPLDPQTMTEVGTKLDLARAYIDMGDPDGAKSILEEVLSEGDSGQRSEAQALIDALPA